MAANAIPTEIKAAADEEFDHFVQLCESQDKWRVALDNPDCKVWDQPSETEAINMVKMWAVFTDVEPIVLYDVLHDPDYRSVWDDNMIEGTNIEVIDKFNDVGYYAAKAPTPVANRDWVNQRSWRVKEGKEYLIMNHSVIHPKGPEKKGFVRARSILTGYLVRARAEGGCTINYLSQNDPRGWIPSWLTNKVTKTFAPKIVDKLHHASLKYEEWKKEHNPNHRPWRIFDN